MFSTGPGLRLQGEADWALSPLVCIQNGQSQQPCLTRRFYSNKQVDMI